MVFLILRYFQTEHKDQDKQLAKSEFSKKQKVKNDTKLSKILCIYEKIDEFDEMDLQLLEQMLDSDKSENWYEIFLQRRLFQ